MERGTYWRIRAGRQAGRQLQADPEGTETLQLLWPYSYSWLLIDFSDLMSSVLLINVNSNTLCSIFFQQLQCKYIVEYESNAW